VLASTATPLVSELGERLMRLLRGERPAAWVLPTTTQLDDALLDDYPGEYSLSPNFSITIRREDGVLRGQATAQASFRLWPSSRDAFYLRVVAAAIRFERDAADRVIALVLDQNGVKQRASRR
jgi:serine-type D-Ala-D-Ala carboxypeptidase/endopeptidase